MYIRTTNENLFSKEDIYESLISHCGLEYASSVFRILGANKEFEFDEKQSQIEALEQGIEALEQELDSYTMDLDSLTSGVQEVLDMLDDALDKKRINRASIENVRKMLVRLT